MTQQAVLFTITRLPTADVAEKRFVGFDGNQVDVAGAKAMGVSQYGVSAGRALPVNVHGTAKVRTGAAIPLLAKGLTPVKSDATGKAIPQAGAGEILGYALYAAGAADVDTEILLTL